MSSSSSNSRQPRQGGRSNADNNIVGGVRDNNRVEDVALTRGLNRGGGNNNNEVEIVGTVTANRPVEEPEVEVIRVIRANNIRPGGAANIRRTATMAPTNVSGPTGHRGGNVPPRDRRRDEATATENLERARRALEAAETAAWAAIVRRSVTLESDDDDIYDIYDYLN